MARVVAVSNRLADPRKTAAGGLAVALGPTLNETGGLWFGWSGRIVDDRTEPAQLLKAQLRNSGNVTLATVDLTQSDHDTYYLGYSNSVLWPVFHYRLDLAEFRSDYLDGYRRVNRQFAQALLPLLRDDDVIWVHDYHLIPLAAELRTLGCKQRIGFFLHIPLPPPLILAALPAHDWLLRSLFAYDLLGLQSEADAAHFAGFVMSEARAHVLPDHRFHAFGRVLRAQAFPIGIDVQEFRALAAADEAVETWRNTSEQYAKRQLLVGVDRLDYSKGLPQRLQAFNEMLHRYPVHRNSATLIQIASPSRSSVEAYAQIRTQLELLCGSINGEFGELDWMPVRYLYRTISRRRLPGLYRASRVGLVTPLRDGMNLVAKEYVLSQEPENPGVLVLSRFTGAAEQLREALLVNPYDISATADAIERALHMPLAERVERHQALLKNVVRYDVQWWQRQFLATLQERAEESHAAV
ncbi:alpha,alpha-trehalose-phosphate synthase (UDP-forming) [Ideonella sp. BN130291]|uniref:alpha,alpha-trehalose-phosphate synthase (UDP-forming) n=1 Tax=Ideonella sp. BN130291 TaxID=3112940 RepID=UPI002E25A590|nr:alpha,alpha-trehalose-phosphate synthase (UDP-forming) [Ideonella sp. BN130291]